MSPSMIALAERLRASALRRLDPALTSRLRERVAEATARWLMATPAHIRPTQHAHLRLSPDAAQALERVNRALSWMSRPERHHGPAAADVARKTIRAVEGGRLDFQGLEKACNAFQHHRHGAIRTNALRKSRTRSLDVPLPGTGTVASRVTSEAALVALGREAGNCLADQDQGARYRREFRSGEIEFWRIADADDRLLLVLRTDPGSSTVDEAAGPRNALPTQLARAALIEFMGLRGLAASGLNRIAVSTPIVEATRDGTILHHEVLVAGRLCSLEIAPLAVAGMTHGTAGCWMLTRGTRYSYHCWSATGFPVPQSYDEEDPDEEGDIVSAMARSHLRAACRANLGLARDLHAAFAEAPDWFRDDWFGPEAIPEAAQ
ncbi:hypothetical protein ACI2KH_23040 [Roseomonas mucosa]|uniref:hypothetical protein n=1 Tax=Roseomonas mucosa TaxID=207340 RepID=UPI00384D5CF9